MFDKLFRKPEEIARQLAAPYPKERERYLVACAERGDSKWTLLDKATELYWVAHRLSVYGDLHLTPDQVRAAAADSDWKDRERAWGRKLKRTYTRKKFVRYAQSWLGFLGCLRRNEASIPFQINLESFCRWAREERGFTEASVNHYFKEIRGFLRWYGDLNRPLSEVQLSDIDSYLANGGTRGWCRLTVKSAAAALRMFFRYSNSQGWVGPVLATGIYGPRIYNSEKLPKGPAWTDVQRLLAGLDRHRPKDIRDRAILLLFAIYGLRRGEVARLRLEHLDWDNDLLHVPRVKRRDTQIYPLLPSVGNALIAYLQKVRPTQSPHREVFLAIRSPYGPISSGLHRVVSDRLEALGVQTAHHGPHSLRHASAARLVAEGFSLKEIGDHLGHRTTGSTRIYAKVDLPGLREVAAFDLGALR